MNKTKRTLGCYLGVAAAVIAIAGAVLNSGVSSSDGTVSILLAVAAAIEILAFALSLAAGSRPIYNLIPIVTSVLFAYALVVSFSPQMNQLGNVVAGLDEASSLQGFFVFVGVTAAGLLVSVVSSFTGKASS